MSFANTLLDVGVTWASRAFLLFAIIPSTLYVVPLGLYAYGVYHARDAPDAINILWALLLGLHCIAGLLVSVDFRFTHGMYWPLQTLLISMSTFNTLSLPTLSAYYIVNDDLVGIGISLGALGVVCVANATMVAILMELMHRRMRSPPVLHKAVTHAAPAASVTTLERSRAARV